MENFGLLSPIYKQKFELFEDLLTFLKKIAIKELENKTITTEEYENLFCFGKVLEELITFNQDSDTDDMAVIADVHTDSNYDICLEEGVGYPLEIFVIVNQDGVLQLTRGAVFSYYEFTRNIADRLNDEEWRKLLESNPPEMPRWTDCFRDISQAPLELWDISPDNLYEKEFSSVEDIPSTQKISNFLLQQNFPNPFNPQTTITFEIPYTSNVSVVVYNTLGKKIKDLFKGNVSPGIHTLTWDGTSESGRRVTSGIYFVKLISDTFVEVKKMCLMR